MVAGLGAGVGGAVGMAALLGAVKNISPMVKAVVATGAGLGMYLTIPKRMRLARAASVGAALGGALSLTRQAVPSVPMLAGIDDIGMGVNVRPTATLSQYARRQQYLSAKSQTVQSAIPASRNAMFMGSAGAQWGKFQTPADY